MMININMRFYSFCIQKLGSFYLIAAKCKRAKKKTNKSALQETHICRHMIFFFKIFFYCLMAIITILIIFTLKTIKKWLFERYKYTRPPITITIFMWTFFRFFRSLNFSRLKFSVNFFSLFCFVFNAYLKEIFKTLALFHRAVSAAGLWFICHLHLFQFL